MECALCTMLVGFSMLYPSEFVESSEQLCKAGAAIPHYLKILDLDICLLVKTYLLMAKSVVRVLLWPFTATPRVQGDASCLMCTYPADIDQCNALLSCLRFHSVPK